MKKLILIIGAVIVTLSGCVVVPDHGYRGDRHYRGDDYYHGGGYHDGDRNYRGSDHYYRDHGQ